MTLPTNSVSQHMLELAADYAQFCVLVTTAQLDLPGPQILYANTAFTRMTGYAVADLLGKTPRILQGPATDTALLRNLRTTLEAGDDFIARAVNYKRSGEPFELEWIITRLRDSEGRTTHYIAVQRDITGMRRAEHELLRFDDELRDARTRLLVTASRLQDAENAMHHQQRFTLLGELAAGVMHDISNALTPVFGLAQLLGTVDDLPPRARELSRAMDASIDHALGVLANLKSYYQHPQQPTRSQVDLADLLRRLPDITSARWWTEQHQANNRFTIALHISDRPVVEGNEVELLQVLVNLVLNAIDAMPDGGTIDVRLGTEAGQAHLAIVDTGEGMTPELAASCFNPYVTSRRTGSGLGLAVCRRVIENHGGTICVSTDQPRGVTFHIRLPCQAPDRALPRQEAPVHNVLVAGGSATERGTLQQLLEQLGHGVRSVDSPDAALEQLFATDCDCVILHCGLAPTRCADLTQTLRRARPETRVVWWFDDDRERRVQLSATPVPPDATLLPPFAPAMLTEMLQPGR